VCGARTRRGLPCQRRRLMRGGRCACHGGRSTGPRTADGLQRAVQAMHQVRHTPEGALAHSALMKRLWADPEYRIRVLTSRLRAQQRKDFKVAAADRYNLATWHWFDERQARRRVKLIELELEAPPPPRFDAPQGHLQAVGPPP